VRTTKRIVQLTAMAAGAVGMVAASTPESALGRRARRLAARLARDARYVAASTPGIVYRLAGRRPDPTVADDVLADRVRSELGPVEKRLDIPRIHVMVEDHVAVLHGDVTDAHTARMLEHAVMRVSGVRGIESHLHCGLARGDTRPSAGSATVSTSPTLASLLDAARAAGADGSARTSVHAVLCSFLERLPATEREHVRAHLPADVLGIAGPPHRRGESPPRLRTVPQLVAAVTAEGGVDPARADAITRAVLEALRAAVPEEADDIAAVLPTDLRELWATPAHAS